MEGLHSGVAAPSGSGSSGGLGIARPAPLELPPRLEMVLADVDTGSNTPSLVGKVMAWRKAKPEWGACEECLSLVSQRAESSIIQPLSSTPSLQRRTARSQMRSWRCVWPTRKIRRRTTRRLRMRPSTK